MWGRSRTGPLGTAAEDIYVGSMSPHACPAPPDDLHDAFERMSDRPKGSTLQAWMAGLLSVVVAGLGQAYAGRPGRGFGVFVLSAVAGSLSLDLGGGIGFAAFVTVWLWVVIDAVRCARRAAASDQTPIRSSVLGACVVGCGPASRRAKMCAP